MIVNHSTWKEFITNHNESAWLDDNIAAISAAFDPTKTDNELMETALGVDPNIFLILPSDTMQPTLVHHVSKAPKNALLTNDADEYFCLLGWDHTAMPIKINPTTFFAKIDEGGERLLGARENGGRVRKVPTRRLKDALTKEAFSRCQFDQNDTITVRKCIPLPPVLANLILQVNPSDPHQMGFEFGKLIFEIERDNNHILHDLVTSQAAGDMIDEILTWFFLCSKIPIIQHRLLRSHSWKQSSQGSPRNPQSQATNPSRHSHKQADCRKSIIGTREPTPSNHREKYSCTARIDGSQERN